MNGFLVSDCLLPCLRTEVRVEEGTTSDLEDLAAYLLLFNNEVRVKKISVDQFSFMGSLNFFGSNLGLWPGLGLYQILEWWAGVTIVNKMCVKITSLLFK